MNFARATDGKSVGGGLGWLLLAQSVIYAVAVLMLTGLVPHWGQWYSRSHFRAQTAALLRGELALSSDPGRLEHDLSWSGSGVQQVWGLGIPLWRLPFEAIGSLGRGTDRVAAAAGELEERTTPDIKPATH